MKFNIQRYNIYSCTTISQGDVELCFDPAKIRNEDIRNISPNYIFISHESMDHMDPAQVYTLQKKKNAKIYCSIAAAVDLWQSFPYDYDFIKNINAMVPGSKIKCDNLLIETCKSIHCDYMMPLVFKISLIDKQVSFLHCFDSIISNEIIELSKNASLSIIPIGIAKGVSVNSGIEFMNSLHSKMFLTNHFKSTKELIEFSKISDNDKCIYLDWNQQVSTSIPQTVVDISEYDLNLNYECLNTNTLKKIICNFNSICCEIINNKTLLDRLFEIYKTSNIEDKSILLIIYTLICLLDSRKINSAIFFELKNDLLNDVSNENNSLNVVILFFLGIYAQQSNNVKFIDEAISLANEKMEHLTYWVVQFLGRAIVANKQTSYEITNKLLNIISLQPIYTSVVVRRQIFWELYRIMKTIPSLTSEFVSIFEDGLTDENPDVELLAVLCFGLANRVQMLTDSQLDKIFNLLNDQEDDVRETVLRIVRNLNHHDYIINNKENLLDLINDHNCHVSHEAMLTEQFIKEIACEKLN